MLTRGIKNCRISRLFKGCSPLQLLCNLTGNHPQSATFSYRHTLPANTNMESSKTIIKSFEKSVQDIPVEMILKLSENDSSIRNVINGHQKECFGLFLYDESNPNFDYSIFYITRTSNQQFEGLILELQSCSNNRNDLTSCFASLICQQYKSPQDFASVFNTFQIQQRNLFEKYNYWVIDESFRELISNKRVALLIKTPLSGIRFVPLAKQNELTNDFEGTDSSMINSTTKNEENFVYIMHNKHNGYYKIGRSKNPKYREKTLQAEEPDIELIYKWLTSANAETALHSKYKTKRIRGEWFRLTTHDINEIKKFMNLWCKRST